MKFKPYSTFSKSLSFCSLIFLSGSLAAATLTNGYSTQNGRIVSINNGTKTNITLHGINWFGFNTGNRALHGLWGGGNGNYVSSQYNTDLRTMIDRIKGLGFNAVRLPFVFDFINNTSLSYNGVQENQNCVYSPNKGEENKPNPNPALNGTGCNIDFKNSGYEQTAWGLFKYTVDQFTKNKIYVLLDDHYEETLYPSEANRTNWVNSWVKVAQAFKNNPYVIGYDLFNEPDSKGLTWPIWGPSAVAAAQKIYSISPNKLIFIEGTGQGSFGANWGTGFKTVGLDYNDTRNPMQYLFDPLFKANKTTPGLLNQIVISPHVYGMDGTNGMGTKENNLYMDINNYDKIFGYLNKSGICTVANGTKECQVFPLAIGEFGATLGQSKSPYSADGDEGMMNILGAYMQNKNVPANTNDVDVIAGKKYHVKQTANGYTANHNPIYDYFYWSWNPNSGNTGGILGSFKPEEPLDEANWTDIVWKKVNYLNLFLGLNASGTQPIPVTPGELCLVINKDETQAAGLQESNFAPIQIVGNGNSYTLKPIQFNTPVCDSVEAGSYTIKASTLYNNIYQYDSAQQSAEISSNSKTTSTLSYKAALIKNLDIRVSGLQGTQKSILTLTNMTNKKTYTFTLTPTNSTLLTHLDPGTYTVSASAISGLSIQISPTKITIAAGATKVSVLVSYLSATTSSCTIQFKPQGSAPTQYYPNLQYTFKVEVKDTSITSASNNWKLNFQFGSDVVGLDNYWNMAKPALLDKLPNASDPYAFDVIPVGSWQTFGPSNPINFDQIGYIEKLQWKDNFQVGVNTIPSKVTLMLNSKIFNCTPSLAAK